MKSSIEGRYAWTARVGEKGQIVIPKQARDLFNISPGDTVLILGDAKRGLAIVDGAKFSELYEKVIKTTDEDNDEFKG